MIFSDQARSTAVNIVVVAGRTAHEAESASRAVNVKPSTYRPGCLDTETLIAWQTGVGRRWRSVQVCRSKYGWCVRATSGLDGFALLAGSRDGYLDGTFKDALRWANEWVAQDPEHRYAYCWPSDAKEAALEAGLIL
jgi:hypothetical protein